MPRPLLPVQHANPHFTKFNNHESPIPPVKYQVLNCQGKDILVGRLKIDITNGGHAFILRRFDTNAVSLTTMFRAAYPNADDIYEKAEVSWVKENYNLFGMNGSSKEPHITRLAGTWVDSQTALELAREYNMVELIQVIVSAVPDPTAHYRRSHKSAQPVPHTPAPATGTPVKAAAPLYKDSPNPASKSLPTPSPTSADSQPATKRRREGSPAILSSIPPAAAPPNVGQTPRRSTRAKSPAPSRAPQPLTATQPKSRASVAPPSPQKKVEALPESSPIKGEEDHAVETNVATHELYEQDMAEQKALIENLKAKAADTKPVVLIAKLEEVEEVVEEDQDMGETTPQSPVKLKRSREEEIETLQFEFKEPELEERPIATNRRVGSRVTPQTKSLAWGLAAFAVGMSAISFLPNFL